MTVTVQCTIYIGSPRASIVAASARGVVMLAISSRPPCSEPVTHIFYSASSQCCGLLSTT